jgi:hypothetical protein
VVEQVAVNHLVVGSNPTRRVLKIPQLDFTTLSTVLFSSLISAFVYYSFIALRLLPDILTVLKFRTKKLFKEDSLNLNLIVLPNLFSYDLIVRKKK